MTTDLERVSYVLKNRLNTGVIAISSTDWFSIIEPSGEPTKITQMPVGLKGLERARNAFFYAGSGILNGSPGIDVVRWDEKDAPYHVNIDHYKVIEDLSQHEEYPQILQASRVNESDLVIQQYVFVVGPLRTEQHWSEEIPEPIKNAVIRSHNVT